MSAAMNTPYRDSPLRSPVPEFDQSFARARNAAPTSGIGVGVFVCMLLSIVSAPWVTRFMRNELLALITEIECIAVILLFPSVWAAINHRRLRAQWLAEALADQRAIEAIERGEVPLNE